LNIARAFLSLVALILALAAPGVVSAAAAQQPDAATPPRGAAISSQLELQILLDRAGFSPGEIDGIGGANTNRALAAFRRARNLEGASDAAVRAALEADGSELITSYTISAEDAAGPFATEIPADMMEQAKLPALAYMSVLEMIGERTHTSPRLLQQLNPGITFAAGDQIRVPNVERVTTATDGAAAKPTAASPTAAKPTPPATSAAAKTTPAGPAGARVVVSRGGSGLTVYDADARIIFFAPVTSGSEHDPLPLGTWTVTAVARNPTFNYNPALFWDADPAHAKVKLPAGPNGPVGTVWIDLSKPHYGIHGTPEPRRVGHAASHGCVRLTNWDAETVARLVRKGTVVIFEP
jgi:lipoprotein-anchoring transpeptidase ErfK/SrfK